MKPKIIKSFDKLDPQMHDLLKQKFPLGFESHLIAFTEKEGKYCKALPFETDEYSYLIKINSCSLKMENEEEDEEKDLYEASNKIDDMEENGHAKVRLDDPAEYEDQY